MGGMTPQAPPLGWTIATLILLLAAPAIAAPSVGRSTASATARVSVTIPQIAGIDLAAAKTPLTSTRGAGVVVSIFQTGNGAMLIRTAPHLPWGVVRAAYRGASDDARIIGGSAPGWQQLHDTPPARAMRTSTNAAPDEITYELWQF